MLKKSNFLALILIFACGNAFAEKGTIVRNSKLFESPAFNAKVVKNLAIGTEVESLKRKGGWKQVLVRGESARGWIRGYTMRAGVSASQVQKVTTSDSDSGIGLASIGRSLTGLFGGKKRNENEGNLTTTVGIRGLSAEQIEGAKPDVAAAKKMIAQRVSVSDSTQFAKQAKLKSNKLAHIKKSKAATGQGGNNDK